MYEFLIRPEGPLCWILQMVGTLGSKAWISLFQYVGNLLRDVKDYVFIPEQLSTLLLYVEQDLHDPLRQASGFLVLKAILHRKLSCGDLTRVMKGVAKLAITSYHVNVRVQAKQVSFYSHGCVMCKVERPRNTGMIDMKRCTGFSS